MRPPRTALALIVAVLALTGAGCGSNEADVPEVPGSPAELTVPHQSGAADLSEGASGSATPTPTPSADGAATPAPTAAPGTTGSTGATGTTGTNTGAAATPAPATQDSPTTDTAPPAGSAPEKFEQFCQENAGAC